MTLPVVPGFGADPAGASASQIWPETLVYAGLLKFDTGMNVVPDLAVALPGISGNGLSFTFTLRSDARFANGDFVTPANVIYSFSRALLVSSGHGPAWNALGDIVGARRVASRRARLLRGVRATGSRTLVIRLSRPNSEFLDDLALPATSVLDRRLVRQGGDWWLRGVSAGPFQIRRLGLRIVLSPNDYYYGRPPSLRHLTLLPVPNIARSYGLYLRHKIQATLVPPSTFAAASTSPDFIPVDSSDVYVAVPMGVPRSARIGLDEALDRSALSAASSPVDPSDRIVPATVQSYPAAADPYSFNPLAAHLALLHLPPVGLAIPAGTPPRLTSWLRHSWQSVALRLTSGHTTVPAIRLVRVGVMPPTAQRWLGVMGRLLSGRQRSSFRALLRRADEIVGYINPVAQFALDQRAERLILGRALIIPIGIQRQGYLIGPSVHGLTAAAFGFAPATENWADVTTG